MRTIAKEDIQRFSRKKPRYWTLEFDLSYQQTRGNKTSDDFRTALNVKKKKQKYELIFSTFKESLICLRGIQIFVN